MLITFSACGIGNIALAVAANGRFFLNYFGTELALSRFTGVQSSAFGPNAITIPMMGLTSSEIKNAAMNELPLFSVIAPATKHNLIQMIMTRNTMASMSEVNHTGPKCVADKRSILTPR
jgi:hypothetical protein